MGLFKKEKIVDIITSEVITGKNKNVSIGRKIIKTVRVTMCEMCFFPTKKTIKCSGKKCKKILCKGCITYINDSPFCNDCVVEIVREKSVLIITKP